MAAASANMTPGALQSAVESLFRLNNYDVEGPLQIDGASVDLRAVPRGDLFGRPIYLELTVQKVDNAKYGKDLTKLAPCRSRDPLCDFVIVSLVGFTEDVVERARAAGVTCLTYRELHARFEKFAPYERLVLDEGHLAEELARLNSVYEEPNFEDGGKLEPASEALLTWLTSVRGEWLILVGEYGTGKTALTKIALRRLMQRHRTDPTSPIPVRIELRDFTRQFDAAALLHRFLDQNQLGHVPVDFFFSLIRQGRVILLLDGYDEMAQYMHLVERRVCLEALADLGREGAVGVLTSRPNYFSEAEELNVLETLYTTLGSSGAIDTDVLSAEMALDELLQKQFLERRERRLQDLDTEQTKALVERSLANHPERAAVVLELLHKVSRATEDGRRSLSGKPVIISYLMELADSLASERVTLMQEELSEYDCFRMIIDRLMDRDKARAPMLSTSDRRRFLRDLAVFLSGSTTANCTETDFLALVNRVFDKRLKRLPGAERDADRQQLFADLRSSATLTRVTVGGEEGWRFSHNSLREFLVVEHLLTCLVDAKAPGI